MFVDFKPGDVVHARLNPDYHVPNRPYFDTVEIKGGGDAVSAARAVLQTGEYDYAWNMQVEDEILLRLESAGKGKVSIVDERQYRVHHAQRRPIRRSRLTANARASRPSHPLFSDPAVRQAIDLLIDRASIEKFIYGRTGSASGKFPEQPGARAVEEYQIRIQHRERPTRFSRPPAGKRAATAFAPRTANR